MNIFQMLAKAIVIFVFSTTAYADYIGNASSFEDVDRGFGVRELGQTVTNDSFTTVIKQSITLPVYSAKLDYIFFFGFRGGFPEMSINGVKFFESDNGEIGGDATAIGFKLDSFQVGSTLDILFYGLSGNGDGIGFVGLAENDGSFSPSISRSGFTDLGGPYYIETEGLPVLFGLSYTPVVSVPEAPGYALSLLGLCLIGFVARRKI